MLGIPAGLLTYLAAAWLPRRGMAAAASALLLAGVALLNLAPENPYLEAAVQTWRHGHFLSFDGVTSLVSTLWPFLTSIYLAWWAFAGGKTPSAAPRTRT
jgi:uncharacterized membrane protein